MSANHRKGYDAEHRIEVLLQKRYPRLAENILRPRAGAAKDKGDIHGLPVVISVKNYSDPHLGPWVDQMKTMCEHANKGVGVVWWKRRGKGSPEEWYVTTDDMSFALMHDKFLPRKVHMERAGIVLSAVKMSGWMNVVETNRLRVGAPVGALHHARRGHDFNDSSFITMTGASFVEMLDDYVMADRVQRNYEANQAHGRV